MEYREGRQQQKNINTKRRYTECETGPPVITVDYERYAHFLENADLTEDQKREFCQALWNIVVEFVSLGFGVHPLQQAKNPCGKVDKNSPKAPLTAPDGLYLDHQFLRENLKEFAALKSEAVEEGVEA